MSSDGRSAPGIWEKRLTYLPFLVLILLLSFLLRIVDLEHIPPFVHFDEVNNIVQARRVLNGELPLFGIGYSGHTNLSFLIQYFPYLAFGGNLWAIRITSVLWSMLALSAVYFGTRVMFGPRVATIATLLMAVAHTMIQFGRQGQPYIIQSVFVNFLLVGVFLKAECRQPESLSARLGFLLTGMILGINAYQYATAQPAFFWVAAVWLLMIGRRRKTWRIYTRNTLYMAAGFLVIAAPLLRWYLQHPHDLVGRAESLSIFSHAGIANATEMYGTADMLHILLYQVARSFGAFIASWDTNPNYGIHAPVLDPITGMLLLPGLGFAILKKPRLTVTLLIWFLVAIIAGAVMLTEPPNSSHYIVLVPLAIIFAAIGLSELIAVRASRPFVPLILAGICFLNIYLYFNYYPEHGAWYSRESDVGYYVRDLRGCCEVIYIGNPMPTPRAITAFVAAPTMITYVDYSDRLLTQLRIERMSRRVVVIIPNEYKDSVLPSLQLYFPSGTTQSYIDRGKIMFYIFSP